LRALLAGTQEAMGALGVQLAEDASGTDVSFLVEREEHRHVVKATPICVLHEAVDWHGRLGGGVQADAMVDRLVHGSVRIDLGDVNVRKLLAEGK
jgi:hypothetical protein